MDEQHTWVDDVVLFNSIALAWFQNITQPATTSTGTVQVTGGGVSAQLSPGFVLLLLGLGVAIIFAINR